MSDTEAQYFVQSFVRFLHKEIAERNFSPDIVESLEVAAQCLETAYNLPVVVDTTADGGSAVGIAEYKDTLSHIDIYELFQSRCVVQPDQKLEAENIKNEGNCLMREEKYQEALKAYNRAINLDPTNPVFYCNRAAAHSRLNDYQRAADDCKLSLRYDPNYSKAYGRMGIAYSKLNKHDLALKAYQSALELEPNNVDYLNNLNVAQQRLTESTNLSTSAPTAAAPGGLPAGFGAGMPGGTNALLDGLGNLLNQPGLRETFQQFMQDPALQNMVRTFSAGNMPGGAPTPEMLASLAEHMQSSLENNPHILGNLDSLFPQPPPGAGQQPDQPPPAPQP